MMNKKLYSPKDASKLLGIHIRTLLRLNKKNPQEELVEDLMSIIASFLLNCMDFAVVKIK